jgi:hypothetical protein
MGWPQAFGWVLFLLVPGTLWIVGAIANRGQNMAARLLGFAVGTDGRLSISRVQAFAWTLVIFGSYASAMGIHKKISAASPEEIQRLTDAAAAASDRASTAKSDYLSAATLAKTSKTDAMNAENVAESDETIAKSYASVSSADKTISQTKLATAVDARATADGAAVVTARKEATAEVAKANWDQAEKDSEAAQAKATMFNWLTIPNTLLMLTGIAVGSGVFSSLIAVLGGEDKTAQITGIRSINKATANQYPNMVVPAQTGDSGNSNYLVIDGTDLGTSGSVRLVKGAGKDAPVILAWTAAGNQIVLDVPDGIEYRKLIVDTSNGKVVYKVSGKTPGLLLGPARAHYEIADLFRDDKHPGSMDLMKFQMFGWTCIALCIYVSIFLSSLTPALTSLPDVDSSIAVLTGVSQAAYLSGKGVSNVSSGPDSSKS